MQLLSRIFGRDRKVSPPRHSDRPARRNRARVGVEAMEERNLLSDISVQWGQLVINAPQSSGNQVYIWNDANGRNLDVWLNHQFYQFDRSQVYWVNYNGGSSGGDFLENDAGLNMAATMNGGGNTLLGSWSAYNYVVLWGDYNTYDARGGASNVYAYGGPNDNITSYSNVYVTAYSFSSNPWGS
jgi:hypothetical protein